MVHANIDPTSFAIESFNVTRWQRSQYRFIDGAMPKPVDPSGVLADGREFYDIVEFQNLVSADSQLMLRNLTERLTLYATGRPVGFADRDRIPEIVARTQQGAA